MPIADAVIQEFSFAAQMIVQSRGNAVRNNATPMRPMCKFYYSFLIGLTVLAVRVQAASQVIISEFMAQNTTSISDDFGDKSDWIEIYNGGTNAIDLGGWHLTDATNELKKWTFPTTILPANSYLLVFASNRDRRNPGSPLHTNFRIEAIGEYLALIQPDGTNIAT